MEPKSQVLIIMGSDSDLPIMEAACNILKDFGIGFEVRISSAHRAPAKTAKLAKEAEGRGIEVIIAGAGSAAHLAGVISAETILPVIGVPIGSSALQGVDSLYSTVMMPQGVPVATMAIGKAGAANAAILATQILARKNPELAEKLHQFKNKLAEKVEEKDESVRNRGVE